MSSLYRCRARVAYRPYGSDKLIVFEERQIQELAVKLKWQPNLAFSNADQATPASVYTNALSQSTCSVTVSDPYLTGLAWPALFDAAALYTAATHAAANNILLPACKEGQDPNVDKCFQFVDLEANSVGESGAETSGTAKFAHLILSLWYDVKGTSFGTDFYFRVDGISISHGTKYPSVTLRGVEARSVLFNQSLVNMSFDEGMTVEEAVKKLAEDQGYEASFCANGNENGGSPRTNVLNRSVRLKGATPDEILKKLVNATGGNVLTQPIREYANKISICTRGEVNQGCTVFYLGKGLYEGYEITAQPDISLLNQNMESGGNFNNADPYVSQSFAANTYIIDDIAPNKRKAALEKVKKLTFPQLFTSCAPRCQGWPTSSGYIWKGAGPGAINEKVKDTILYGIAPNGTTSISFLKGVVEEAGTDTGKVVIKTDFFLRMCEDAGRKKCFSRPILQESSNLTTVSVKTKDKVEVSKEIGKSTTEKKEFVRFYINGHNNEMVVLDPQLVWKYAVPFEELSSVESSVVNSQPASAVVPPAPKQSLRNWNATTSSKPSKVLITPGHADLISSGASNEARFNIELVKWAQRNAAAYGIQDFVEFYFPPSSNLPANNSNSLFSRTSAAIAQGKQVIEIHNDELNGKSGVIPPTGGKTIWPLDEALSEPYGAFTVNHRDGLGIPKRGGTILEVGRMDAGVQRVFSSGSAAQKDALYKQLMDPTMKAIAAEKARSAGSATSTTTAGSSPPSAGQPAIVGRVGSTGSSSGPHLHAQWEDGRAITAEQVREFVNVPGTVTSPYNDPSRSRHLGVDIGGNDRAPIELINGASVASVGETKCTTENVRSDGCGGGFGNNVTINTPKGRMILAHLAPQSIPPNIAGLSSSSGAGKTQGNIQSAGGTKGAVVETGFKGVPRALRIIPGRTILSFVTEYDEWIEGGRQPNAPDPGVWIPRRFKNWFINECEYKWRDGDLRIQIEGVSQWGTGMTQVPLFSKYMESMKAAGEIKLSASYYDYIRSLGTLAWKTDDGKDSTEVHCKEAQEFAKFLSEGSESGGSPDVSGSYPTANCQNPGSQAQNAIMGALRSAGINTQNAYAGVLGNLQEESGFDPNVHNTSRQGFTCLSTSGAREKCYGIAQWGGSRKVAALAKCGQTSTLQCQLEFMVQEIAARGGGMVQKLNGAKNPGEAAVIWARDYEVSDISFDSRRVRNANAIVGQLKCDR